MTTNTIERSQINSANTRDRRVALKWKTNVGDTALMGEVRAPPAARCRYSIYPVRPFGGYEVFYVGRGYAEHRLEGTWLDLAAAKAAAEADYDQRRATKERGAA
jgi:hypothetical protein